MSAIRLARAATGRDIIVKFEGCYHGHSDGLLVKAGSGVATFGIPGSAGVPDPIAHLTLALPYNDIAAVEAAFDAHHGVIAAVIIEPIVGNAGCIPPAPGYLSALRALTTREGALLIVDEVMTGFRVALGGACELYSLDPDIITLGKIVGGGSPSASSAASRSSWISSPLLAPYTRPERSAAILWQWPPASPPSPISRPTPPRFTRNSKPRPKPSLKAWPPKPHVAGIPLTTNRVGAMGTWFFTPGQVTNYDEAAKSDTALFGRFHNAMLNQGIWLPPSQFEAAFLSTAHGDAEIQATITAAAKAFQSI